MSDLLLEELFELEPGCAPAGAKVSGRRLQEGSGGRRALRSYREEKAVEWGILQEGGKLVLGSMLVLYEKALAEGDERLVRELDVAIDVEAARQVEGKEVCEACGGVIPALQEANPWHDPATGKFGKPAKAIWSLHFRPGPSGDTKRKAVNTSKQGTGSAKPIRGQPCGCEQLKASGVGCQTKHKSACKELQWGATGKALKGKVALARRGKEKERFKAWSARRTKEGQTKKAKAS